MLWDTLVKDVRIAQGIVFTSLQRRVFSVPLLAL
ncbi:hypothetical protein EZJ58_1687 [Sodalis ligni]|jgi:hypothetical protein|uniref:Uncharacterized protein n=1 Tax=Sodalis ligni TaxID=2697027 RepID=A0A4R1NDA5_9GAMM|nr:hypothetical protein EZJ58_1687 [Sodalis ligni]